VQVWGHSEDYGISYEFCKIAAFLVKQQQIKSCPPFIH
jgi:hypothetical protein